MFEINTSEEFSTSQQQKAFNSNSTFADSPIAYGLEAKQENLIASSLSDLQKNESSNQVNGFALGVPPIKPLILPASIFCLRDILPPPPIA